MGIHGRHDIELKIDSTTDLFRLMKDETGRAMYKVETVVPQYRNPLTFSQANWIGGHGQFDMQDPTMYFEGQSIDTTQEGRVFLGPYINEVQEDTAPASDLDAPPVKFCWFPAVPKLLCATATSIYHLDTQWDVTVGTAAGVTDMAVFGSTLFAARGNSTAYLYTTDADNFTTSTLTDNDYDYFTVAPNADGNADILWGAKTPNQLWSNPSGINSADEWTGPVYVGDTSSNITSIFVMNDLLMIGKTDGLYYYDGVGVHPLRPDLKISRSTDNYKYVTDWQSGIYHSEIDGMGEITSYNAYEPMGPLTKVSDGAFGDIGKRGDIVGLAADKDWLYVAIDEGTNTIIYKGREVRLNGALRWQWCPWVFLGAETTATLQVVQHSATDRRLWFGYTDSTAYVILSDDPTADSVARFCAAGWLRMSYDSGTDKNWNKLWQSCVREVVGGASGETVAIQYRDDIDTTPTSIVAASATNGVTETNFSAALNNKRIQFEIHLASDTNTATPEVSYFQAKGIEKPTVVRTHEMVFDVGDEPSNRVKTLRDLLRTASTSTTLVKFADLRYGMKTSGTSSGDYVWCIVEPGTPEEIEVLQTRGEQPRLGIRVRLKEVSFTIS